MTSRLLGDVGARELHFRASGKGTEHGVEKLRGPAHRSTDSFLEYVLINIIASLEGSTTN